MNRVQWSDSAIRDLHRARRSLDEHQPDDAQEIIDRIVLSTDLLLRSPGIGTPVGYRRWRKWRARRTAYLVFYQADRAGLTVVRVLHERSDWVSATE